MSKLTNMSDVEQRFHAVEAELAACDAEARERLRLHEADILNLRRDFDSLRSLRLIRLLLWLARLLG